VARTARSVPVEKLIIESDLGIAAVVRRWQDSLLIHKGAIMKSIQLLVSVAALSIAGIAGASTRVSSDVSSVVVKYGDLNLATTQGVATLHTRLRSAAKSVCAPLDTRILGLRDAYTACVSDAITRSIADVGNENLSKYHRSGEKSVVLASN
jgi:UrcA family protein